VVTKTKETEDKNYTTQKQDQNTAPQNKRNSNINELVLPESELPIHI